MSLYGVDLTHDGEEWLAAGGNEEEEEVTPSSWIEVQSEDELSGRTILSSVDDSSASVVSEISSIREDGTDRSTSVLSSSFLVMDSPVSRMNEDETEDRSLSLRAASIDSSDILSSLASISGESSILGTHGPEAFERVARILQQQEPGTNHHHSSSLTGRTPGSRKAHWFENLESERDWQVFTTEMRSIVEEVYGEEAANDERVLNALVQMEEEMIWLRSRKSKANAWGWWLTAAALPLIAGIALKRLR